MEAASDPLSWDSIPSIPPSAMRAVKDITFGSIAGMVSKVFEHPFDLTKTVSSKHGKMKALEVFIAAFRPQ
jgi:hypothetical protein